MEKTAYKTKSGLDVTVTSSKVCSENALKEIIKSADTRKAGIFSSGFEYPGRHARWDIAFKDPALEFSSNKKDFEFIALNEQGEGILALVYQQIKNAT